MRRLVLIGQKAEASGSFLLDDLPGTSGRLDVLVRAVRAALLVSHGVRRDVAFYAVMLGGRCAPRTLRIDGAKVTFLRPDERSIATLFKKTLGRPKTEEPGFAEVRPGVALAEGGLEVVLGDVGGAAPFVLDPAGEDIRRASLPPDGNAVFFAGDHLGLDAPTRAAIAGAGARALSLGPAALHTEDAVAVAWNELDRRHARSTP